MAKLDFEPELEKKMDLLDPDRKQDHRRGSASPAITVVEYGDFECPHCAHAAPLLRRLEERYSDVFCLVFRHNPRIFDHPHATLAAESAEAAASEGKFWEMHDLLFSHQDHLEISDLLDYARSLMLDVPAFHQALQVGSYRQRVHEDQLSGTRNRILATPTLFFNRVRYSGPLEYDELEASVDQALQVAGRFQEDQMAEWP